jgi:hypothetical protein
METSWSQFCTDQTKSIKVFTNVFKHKKFESVVETAIEFIGTEEGQHNLYRNNFANYCLNDEKECPEFADWKNVGKCEFD